MSVATLSKSLPKPKYTGEEEELHESRATRVLSAEQYETQIVKKQNGPPAYGQRMGWRPRAADDFGKSFSSHIPLGGISIMNEYMLTVTTLQVTVARFPRCTSHSIHWTWEGRAQRAPRTHWQ
jgi:hypothetical protein